MARRNVPSNDLLDLKGSQFLNQPWPYDKTDEQSGQNRVDGPERDVSKDIEDGVEGVKRIKKMVEHALGPPLLQPLCNPFHGHAS